MRLPWKRDAVLAQTMPVSLKKLELEAAKQILSEVFQVRPGDVEEMIQKRLEEKIWPEGHENGPFPAMFCLGE